MTKQALDSAAAQINGDRPPRMGLDHDPTVPPLGKCIRAWVEPSEDGEHQLVIEQEIFDQQVEASLPDGTRVYLMSSQSDKRPFARPRDDVSDHLVISLDPANFPSDEHMTAMFEELHSFGEFEEKTHFRKSLIPDPEIIFTIGKSVVAYLLGRKVLDGTVNEMSEDLARLYRLTKEAGRRLVRSAMPKKRPIIYVFDIPGDPFVQHVATSTDSELVANALLEVPLRQTLQKSKELERTIDAEFVQFVLGETGEWELNYVLTKNGTVIGTPKSAEQTERRLTQMRSEFESAEHESDRSGAHEA